jgi:hypothetical protein
MFPIFATKAVPGMDDIYLDTLSFLMESKMWDITVFYTLHSFPEFFAHELFHSDCPSKISVCLLKWKWGSAPMWILIMTGWIEGFWCHMEDRSDWHWSCGSIPLLWLCITECCIISGMKERYWVMRKDNQVPILLGIVKHEQCFHPLCCTWDRLECYG